MEFKEEPLIDLKIRVFQLHSKLHFLKQKVTATAIVEGRDKEGKIVRIVGHSDKYMPKEIKNNLLDNEKETPVRKGKEDVTQGNTSYHAEQVANEGAKILGINTTNIEVAGQEICEGCTKYIKENNLETNSSFKE